MADMHWIEYLASWSESPDCIVHLGAGAGNDLAAWQVYRPRRHVLVEPNPESLPELRRRTADQPNVEIWPVAVAANDGQGELALYNDPDFASLRPPTRLIELLPGLRQTGQAMVDALAANELVERLNLDDDKANWLLIDTPGEEAGIIATLEEHKQLRCFDRVILCAGFDSLYEGAASAEQLALELQEMGYLIEGAVDNSDPDWPRYSLRLSHETLECWRLRREHEQLKADFGQQLKQAQATAEIDKQTLTKERDTLKRQLQDQRDLGERRMKERHELEKQLKEHKKHAEKAAKEQRSELERQLQAVQEAAESEKASLVEQRKKTIERLEKELHAAREDMRQHQSDLAVALRLQNLRENDLKELQQRYGELQDTNRQQRELLGQLHQRLSAAAEYLQLAQDHPEEHVEIQEGLVEALTGKKGPPG